MTACPDTPRSGGSRGQGMMRPYEVEAMLGLYELGWGTKRIAAAFGCSGNTVKRCVAPAGWVAYGGPRRASKLAGLDAWLEERFFRHRGNTEVVRQDLRRELSLVDAWRPAPDETARWRRNRLAPRFAPPHRATTRSTLAPRRCTSTMTSYFAFRLVEEAQD